MMENLNYISDEELEQLICQVEQNELVTAPPDLEERILEAVETLGAAEEKTDAGNQVTQIKKKSTRQKEFYAYCFRVVTSVAAAVALVFLFPQMTDWMEEKVSSSQGYFEKYVMAETIPVQAEVVKKVPDKAAVVAAEITPTKEEVLSDTGVVERIIRNAGWFSKTGNK